MPEETEEIKEEISIEDESSMKVALKALPGKIRTKEEQIHAAEVIMGDKLSKSKTIESDIMFKIMDEKSEGKPRFTSDVKRKAECAVRVNANQEHNKFKTEMDDLSKQVLEAKIQLSYLKRMFRAADALARVGE